jgi:glutathione S-transferase
MVPALEDVALNGEPRPRVFESSACLQYIACKYDAEGIFSGNSDNEKAQVFSWIAMHDSGLG